MVHFVPPGNYLVVDVPLPLWYGEREVEWWVTRTTRANVPVPESRQQVWGNRHEIWNAGSSTEQSNG